MDIEEGETQKSFYSKGSVEMWEGYRRSSNGATLL